MAEQLNVINMYAPSPERYGQPLVATQHGWANMVLPVNQGIKVHMVAAVNEVLRHCRVGKVTFKDAQNHSA